MKKSFCVETSGLEICVPVDLDEIKENLRSDARGSGTKVGKTQLYGPVFRHMVGPLGGIFPKSAAPAALPVQQV